jgi:hypothetical protein
MATFTGNAPEPLLAHHVVHANVQTDFMEKSLKLMYEQNITISKIESHLYTITLALAELARKK